MNYRSEVINVNGRQQLKEMLKLSCMSLSNSGFIIFRWLFLLWYSINWQLSSRPRVHSPSMGLQSGLQWAQLLSNCRLKGSLPETRKQIIKYVEMLMDRLKGDPDTTVINQINNPFHKHQHAIFDLITYSCHQISAEKKHFQNNQSLVLGSNKLWQ